MIDKQLLDILVCPQCKGTLALADAGKSLLCSACQLKYPIREDVPVMLISEATDLKGGKNRAPVSNLPKATFRVAAGPDAGLKFALERGTCRAVGRGESSSNHTTILNVDIALSIDESTKVLILQYITKQFRKASGKSAVKTEMGEQLGFFRRVSDIVLTDQSLSRLHAMIFTEEREVGVLDLVSKNGTFVNGKEVESALLRKGDVIEMGETKIVFED